MRSGSPGHFYPRPRAELAVHEKAIAIISRRLFASLSVVYLFLFAQLVCGLFSRAPQTAELPFSPSPSSNSTPSPLLTSSPLPSFTPTPLPTNSPTLPPTVPFTSTSPPTPLLSDTPIPTITPTYAILRGKVIPERANCRYGPGWMYLYKYGLVGGSNLEIIGRTGTGDWVLLQAIGGNNPCWVRADLMQIQGDVLTVAPVDVHVILPWSPYYTPLTNVSAIRVENTVTVSWSPIILRAGDEADPVAYVLEAWVCQNGQLVFAPDGSFQPVIEVIDEPGCDEPSHARVLAAEKHGYTWPVEVPWP